MTYPGNKQENFCFCELAPLYALNVLDEPERRWVEARVQEMPELATEVEEYQAAIATIPYGAPIISMAADLKERLFQRLDLGNSDSLDSQPDVRAGAQAGTGFTIRTAEMSWQPYDFPGLEIAHLYHDPIKREVSCLIRAEAGAQYPSHRHEQFEEIVIIEGELVIGSAVFSPGDYIRSEPNSIHPPAETRQGCLFLLRTALLR